MLRKRCIFLSFYSMCFLSDCYANINSNNSKRGRRTLFPEYTPYNTNAGITTALQVPLQNGKGNVFLSFCFEMQLNMPNFDQPTPEQPFTPPLFYTILEGRGNTAKRSVHEGALTRKKFYRAVKNRLNQSGFNAHFCLLKAICETTQHDYGYRNGIVGDLIYVLFTNATFRNPNRPTSSKTENLADCYYDAEQNGYLGLCNAMYGELCPVSIFDLITILR